MGLRRLSRHALDGECAACLYVDLDQYGIQVRASHARTRRTGRPVAGDQAPAEQKDKKDVTGQKADDEKKNEKKDMGGK